MKTVGASALGKDSQGLSSENFNLMQIINTPFFRFLFIFVIALGFFLFFSAKINATTYYVANAGSDSSNGTSKSTPWQTIAKVNSFSFNPGDSILFNRGDTWREQLTVFSSGSSGNPITFGAYGSGNLPIIKGADLVAGWDSSSVSNIYQNSSIPWSSFVSVIEDGINLTQVTWNTNLGTTSASMSPGTWTYGNTVLYVWATDNADPDNHTMEVSRRDSCIDGNNKDHITIQDIEVRYANAYHGIKTGGGDHWVLLTRA